jgi:hypothetical protein
MHFIFMNNKFTNAIIAEFQVVDILKKINA